MPRCRMFLLVLICTVAFAGIAGAKSPAGSDAWDALVDEFIDQAMFALNPSAATAAGVHTYDSQLEDRSRAGVEKQITVLKKFEARTEAVDPAGLSPLETADRETLLNSIRGSLLSLEAIRSWEKDPDGYSSGAANSIYVIMSRRFAPPDERLRSVVAREEQFPQ
ncbi:MAG TPA: DUF885 family protein, partial [Candidatus Acidoferrum sp.]